MCRYASVSYKTHYACFRCRKAYKQASIDDWLAVRGRGFLYAELSRLRSHHESMQRREAELGVTLAELEAEFRRAAHYCPECREPMADLGLDFKPPRESDEKAWRYLASVYHTGHQFHTCGCDGPGFIPKNKTDYEQYLANRRQSYELSLQDTRNDERLSLEARQEAESYWNDRLTKIDAELATIE